jgi:tryptophan synthase beta chain
MSREAALRELRDAWGSCRADPGFVRDLRRCLAEHAGRPTPLRRADHLAGHLGGGIRLYLKREDLAHTGTHEINSCLGQALLARRMGKARLIAGIGDGRHGVAAASAAAALGLRCVVFADAPSRADREDDLARIRMMGAEVVLSGAAGPEDADREAGRDWGARFHDSLFLPGALVAENPYPAILRDLQSVIGHEARSQMLEAEGRMPDSIIAWAGGSGGPAGLLQAFLDDREVRMFRAVAAGSGAGAAAGLAGDRVVEVPVDEAAARAAFRLLASSEGILPALESAHAVALAIRQAPRGELGAIVLVGLSGRAGASLVRRVSEDAAAAPGRGSA